MVARDVAGDRAWGPRDPLAWALLLAVWMLAHPFAGIRHDGVFYAADALYRLDSSILRQDLFFLAGSPYDASLFGRLYAQAVAAIGLVPASWVLYVGAQLLWAVAAIAWSARFLPARWFLVGAACLSLLPRSYGSGFVLKLAESHLTARSFAEPLVLLALLALARRRLALGGGLSLAAAVLHPIMALPAAIGGGWLILTRLRTSLVVRIAMLAASFAAVILLAASGALGTMDGDWLETTRRRNPFILPGEWDLEYLTRIGGAVLVLLAASHRLSRGARELVLAIAIAALVGVLLAVIGETQGAALILQAQPWRATWVALWAAPFAAVAAASSTWSSARGLSLMFLAAAPASLLAFYGSIELFCWLVLSHAAILALWARTGRAGQAWRRFGMAWLVLLGAAAVFHIVLVTYWLLAPPVPWGGASLVSVREFAAMSLGWVLAPIGLLILRTACEPSERRRFAGGAALLAMIAAVWMIDGRSGEVRQRERWIQSGLPQLWPAIGQADLLFWPGRVAVVWLALGRASYVSMEQMAAQMFDRRISEEGRRRLTLVGALGGSDGSIDFVAARKATQPPSQPDAGAVRRICADRPTMVLLLDFPLDGFPSERVTVDAGTHTWVTRCADVARSGAG